LLPQPPAARAADNPWPQWDRIYRVDYGHTEVADRFGKDPREYSISTKEFVKDADGKLAGLKTVRVEWTKDDKGAWKMAEVPGSEHTFPAQLCLLALGFLGPETAAIEELALEKDPRSNIKANDKEYKTSIDGVFAAGDCRRGQSLIVWGINEGRRAAASIDTWLTGNASLPVAGSFKQRQFIKQAPKLQPELVTA